MNETVEQYLARGGKITHVPTGIISDPVGRMCEKQARKNATRAIKGRKGTKNSKQKFHLTGE